MQYVEIAAHFENLTQEFRQQAPTLAEKEAHEILGEILILLWAKIHTIDSLLDQILSLAVFFDERYKGCADAGHLPPEIEDEIQAMFQTQHRLLIHREKIKEFIHDFDHDEWFILANKIEKHILRVERQTFNPQLSENEVAELENEILLYKSLLLKLHLAKSKSKDLDTNWKNQLDCVPAIFLS